jgi:hypothetical protein
LRDIGRFIVISVSLRITVLLSITPCDKGSAQTMRFASINKRPRSKLRGKHCDVSRIRHPQMFESGVQSEFRLDSRLP